MGNMMTIPNVGIIGVGVYLPEKRMTAKEISEATGGNWSEEAVVKKLGIVEKVVPFDDVEDGTQEMGAKAALDCLKNTGIDPLEIDGILCIGEEWKEYPLTTSACYIQDRIGAKNAWCVDVQNRCCTAVLVILLCSKTFLILIQKLACYLIPCFIWEHLLQSVLFTGRMSRIFSQRHSSCYLISFTISALGSAASKTAAASSIAA